MLPVNIVMSEDTEQMALTLNGKKKNIKLTDAFIRETESSYLTESMKKDMIGLIRSRAEDLGSS